MKLIAKHISGAMALLLAAALVHAAGAGAESTALCSSDPQGGSCPTINHTHEESVGKEQIKTSTINVECNTLFLGDTTSPNGLGAPLEIEGKFSYSACGSCTVLESGLNNAVLSFLRLGHETADEAIEDQVLIECGMLLRCEYNGEGLVGTVKGPLLSSAKNGEIKIVEQTLHRVGGIFCPSTAKVTITTSPLSATYIGS